MNLDELLAEREIYRALVAFAYAMDHRDWDALQNIVHEAATADYGFGPLNGRDAVIGTMRSFLDDCGPTQHLIGNVVIDVNVDDATSRAYVSDLHKGLGDNAEKTFSTLGEYHDQWRRINGKWLLVHRTKLSRAFIGDMSVLGRGLE